MQVPNPTPLFRLIHIDNLHLYLTRNGLNAPNFTPNDGLEYKTIHHSSIQSRRHEQQVPCYPYGVIHDYVPFYFGYLSPMLFSLKADCVQGYSDGQEPLLYLETSAQTIQSSQLLFCFSDGHGIMKITKWFNDLAQLDKVDWNIVYQRYWANEPDHDMDRKRRKQAEFLVYQFCSWSLIERIGVINSQTKQQVQDILNQYPPNMHRPVEIHKDWYF